MANKATVKIGPAIDAKLYREFVAVAKKKWAIAALPAGKSHRPLHS
jgi:hypothetical protein